MRVSDLCRSASHESRCQERREIHDVEQLGGGKQDRQSRKSFDGRDTESVFMGRIVAALDLPLSYPRTLHSSSFALRRASRRMTYTRWSKRQGSPR